ncbi:MAG: hypothetical protein QOD66_3433 [Solirubrobacteraceae bacterium]|nr:hypothetical protein [Solirubrobacteraceae bacterium]
MLTIVLVFILALGVLTALDIAHYGLTAVSVLAVVILILFAIGIVGALTERPRQ